MIFSNSSDVTLVITSCNRLNLLKSTLESFDVYNGYPIYKVIIIEDSVKVTEEEIRRILPDGWSKYTNIIINKSNLGQIKSIDIAYSCVTTDYIFHCEDDWEFYRHNFIEDSKKILNSNPDVIQIWLRDFNSDVKDRYYFHSLGEKYVSNDVNYSILNSLSSEWRGFSFNPSLKRKSDYDLVKPYYIENKTSAQTEALISQLYDKMSKKTVILSNSAVKHSGWGEHIVTKEELLEKRKINSRKIRYFIFGYMCGIFSLYLLSRFI